MKLRIKNSAGVLRMASILAFGPALVVNAQTLTQSNAQLSAQSPNQDTRYGLFNSLDHRSSYGLGVFPEPFLVDDSDLEVNEARLDWVHTKAHNASADELTAELEKGFGQLTLEVELHYERNVDAGEVTDGIGNIDVGARYPLYQFVSTSGFVDSTFGAAVEVGIPVHSSVSKNTEFVPKVFNDLRLGDHFTVQSIVGYSTLFGGGEEGGTQVLEYGFDFGYAIQHDQLPIPRVRQLVPMFELSGETGMNNGQSGTTSLSGVGGFRMNIYAIGRVQPRLGFGVIFPLNSNSRDDQHWGITTSLVFEY